MSGHSGQFVSYLEDLIHSQTADGIDVTHRVAPFGSIAYFRLSPVPGPYDQALADWASERVWAMA